MKDVRGALHALLAGAEVRLDGLRAALRRARGRTAAEVHVYGGHGNAAESVVRGRVLAARTLSEAAPGDPAWRNLLGILARLDSDEIPGAGLRVRSGTASVDVEADGEGYFEARFPTPDGRGPWRPVEVELVSAPAPFEPGTITAGTYQVPPAAAGYGVISDLDDTVIRTDATSLLRMARRTFLHNAHTREAFPGVGTFYRALGEGPGGIDRPFFYVSSSPWNLFDLLVDVLSLNGIPRGTLLLKDYGLTADHLLAADHVPHKLGYVFEVLDTHPELDFVLMGDSGQDDGTVYARVVAERPRRIRAVYLRDIVPERPGVRAAVEQIAAAGVPAVLGRDTGELARSAADIGIVAAHVLEELAGPRGDAAGARGPVVDVPAPDLDAPARPG